MCKTSAIVVTYNRLEYLKECIESLLNQTIPLSHIIIVNNNSTDNTEKYLSKFENSRKFKIYNLKENIGGAGGFNFAMKKFYSDTSDEYTWIMDDDTIPTKEAHYHLIEATKKITDFGFLASNVRWIDDSPAKMNIPTVDDDYWTEQTNYPRLKKATFVSILVSRKILELYGYPIKEFFIWGDDTEFTQRISREIPSYYVPNSIVIHKMLTNMDAAIFKDNSDKNRLKRYEYAYRNRYYYTKKMKSKDKFYYKIKILNDMKRIIFNKNSHKLFKLSLLLKGTWKGMFFNPTIEYPIDK